MTLEILLDAMTSLDSDLLDEALCERARLLPRVGRKVKPLVAKRLGAVAACVAVALSVGLYAKTVFTGSHGIAPYIESFTSVEAVEAALGEDLLLEQLDTPLGRDRDIHVTFPTYEDGSHGEKPLMLKARFISIEHDNSLSTIDATTYVDLYILFDCDSVEDSYIGGYDEQGLSKQYGAINVVYSLIEDGMMHGQAKFLYGGNLYVLDVNSTGDTHHLMQYLDLLLGGEGTS